MIACTAVIKKCKIKFYSYNSSNDIICDRANNNH